MRRMLSLLLLVALIGAATPDTAQWVAPSKLGEWEGHWTFSGQIYQTPYSDHHADTGTADCHWAAGGRNYMICDYFSDNPPHDDLSIMSYDQKSEKYTHINVHLNSEPKRETLVNQGHIWTTQSSMPANGKMVIVRTVFDFVTPNEQTTKVQVSADNGKTWTTMIAVAAVKS